MAKRRRRDKKFKQIHDDPPIYKSDYGTIWQGDGTGGELKSKWYYSLLDGRRRGPVGSKKKAEKRVLKRQ